MALTYTPALYNGTTVLELPQPVYQCKIIDTIKSEQHVVPMKEGGRSYGPYFGPVKIVLTGGIGRHEGTQQVGDDDQWAIYDELRNFLRELPDTGVVEFFPFYDSGNPLNCRKFMNVFVEQFDIDIGDQVRTEWPWELTLRADDVEIYTAAAGEEEAE